MLYPLKFEPILKDKIWGGTKLSTLFGKHAETDKLGESWELSGYEGNESVVTNGILAGNNLTELIEIYMGELVGDKLFDEYGLSFPLLFKLIDANENLSIRYIRATKWQLNIIIRTVKPKCGMWWMLIRELN